jgi:hypothetical protein
MFNGDDIMKKVLAILTVISLMLCLCGCTFLKDLTDFTLNDEAVRKPLSLRAFPLNLPPIFCGWTL